MAEYTKIFTMCDNCGKNNEDNPDMEWQSLKREGGSGDYCSEKCAEEHWEQKKEEEKNVIKD